MGRVWYRHDREAVLAALRRGERPDMATTMACGPLDELVALHEELGILAALDDLAVQRQRAGLADGLLLRTLATLPFLKEASLSGAAGALFREPAILLQLGWAPAQIRAGDNQRHRHPAGRQPESLPCHPDTLRDELRRIEERSWARLQELGVQALYARQLVRGQVYAIDGSGLGADLRLVALGLRKQLRLPSGECGAVDVHDPPLESRQSRELRFHRRHRLRGQPDAAVVGGRHQCDQRRPPLPGHRRGEV